MFWLYCHMDIIIKMYLPISDISSVQLLSCVRLCNPMDCSTPAFPSHHHLPHPTQTHVHRIGDAIQPSHPLSSLLLPPSIFPSIRVFSNESVLHTRWPKYWSFSISLSNEYSGLISDILFSLFQQCALLNFNFLLPLLQFRIYGLSP